MGLITYMRTDGVQMAPEAIDQARAAIAKTFGDRYLPDKPRFYSTKAKNAQEAHEAVRPTDFSRTPDQVRKYLDADQARLYEMIWKRAIASQMEPAEIERTTVEIEATNGGRTAGLRAVGSVVRFDGFLAAYTEVKEDDQTDDDEDGRLPVINANEALERESIQVTAHTTEPPPRYTEATLIKKLEELGIGRPSTYAAILKTLEDRDYIANERRRLIPQPRGRIVTTFLENFFRRYVEYDFTADLEEKLDEISDGKLSWKEVLRDFWRDFSGAVDDIKELRVTDVIDVMNNELAPLLFPRQEDGRDPRICPKCGTGHLSLKLGRYGAFVGCSNYPECSYTRQFGESGENGNGSEALADGNKVLGADPDTGEEITLRNGRFGPYIQRGEGKDAKRAGLPKGWTPDMIDLEKALALLSLPREVGVHPETGKTISAGIGRYGPFLLHDGSYANLDSVDDVFSIGINRAVAILAEKKSRGAGARSKPAALKELGEHPDGGVITVRDGRYGPYVNLGKINATLPKGTDPDSVTLEQAIALIDAKAGSGRSTAKKTSAKASAKTSTAKKATAKKTAKAGS